MNSAFTRSLIIISIMAIFRLSAFAQPAPGLASFNVTATNSFTTIDYTLGYEFQANNNITVTALGFYDVNLDGILASHQVGLWNSSGTLLGSVTVTPSSTFDNGFYYEDFGIPIDLTAGNSYRIGAIVNGDAFVYGGENIVTDPSITFSESYREGPGFVFPDLNDGRIYLTANFKFIQPIPALTSFNTTATNASTSLDMTLGWEFQANSNITVTALGFYDVNLDGILASHQVGLWNSSGTLLCSVTVTPSSTFDNGFYYENLNTPVDLTAGNSYRIGAYVLGDAIVYNGDNIITNTNINFGDTYRGSPGFIFPDMNDGRVYLTANFKFIQLNQPPVAVCQDVTVYANANCSADVTAEQVDNGSYDPDGDEITLTLSPAGPYSLGNTEVTLTVSDGQASSTCSAVITVVDNTPPVLVGNSEPIVLWPPNHVYDTITVSQLFISVSDNCSSLSENDVYIASVSSDELEDALNNGDGNTLNDIVISQDCKSVQLIKERQGAGNGRVYTIVLAVEDGNGNVGTTTCLVTVPHSQISNSAVDDGVVYTVNSLCGTLTKSKVDANNITQISKIPDGYELSQNYPNPFNPTTVINYSLPENAKVSLVVYDVLGRQVVELVNGEVEAGYHQIEFNGSKLTSGIYFYKLTTGNFIQINKMLLMK